VARTATRLHYQAIRSKTTPREYVVEAIGLDGEVYVTIFAGPDAEARASDYAAWKNEV